MYKCYFRIIERKDSGGYRHQTIVDYVYATRSPNTWDTFWYAEDEVPKKISDPKCFVVMHRQGRLGFKT
jgi:hypothetical protein